MPAIRCEKCHAVCGQRRACTICGKRICRYCWSDWRKIRGKACVGLCARTAYARFKNPPRPVVADWITPQPPRKEHLKDKNNGTTSSNPNHPERTPAVRLP
jgi:hypothetical protein